MVQRGRPRSFDEVEALQKAMRAFWSRGYAGVAVNDLPALLGATKPTLYAAFSSKENLFSLALAAYETAFVIPELDALELQPDLSLGLQQWLTASLERAAGAEGPPGCLIVQAGLEPLPPDSQAMQVLRRIQHDTGHRLVRWLEAFWPDRPGTVRLAATMALVARNGLTVSAAAGTNKAELRESVAQLVAAIAGLDAVGEA